ncbi:hypothetical protein PF672P2_00015 [Parabacteroides phage PF672P2]|nr:hypothetical protein PF672P2_00015 [Parabacteroides phage PF672P2]
MADNQLTYAIGFDLEDSLVQAKDAWDSKQSQIEKMFTASIGFNISKNSFNSLEAVQERLKQLKLEPVTPETKKAISDLTAELKSLEKTLILIDKLNQQIGKNAGNATKTQIKAEKDLIDIQTRKEKLYAARGARQAKEDAAVTRQATLQQRLVSSTIQAERAELALAKAKERSHTSTVKLNSGLVSQNMLMNGLKQSLGTYVSILGATRLAENIRGVTAEFQLQKVALTSILQDKVAADQLFNQIVQLAVKSPFQIKEMVGYTKQLAAYRIETENLFDTTKRLADVSAGLGVDMSRLILAYGQVRAASVLRGTEVRQFTEAGIPLIELLADKFTELRGEVVKTGDVFSLISEKAVPFQMVKEVFEDMTDAGGIFYNMQEKQAETLFGIYSNLADAWDIAFNEMGQENLGILTGLGKALTDLGENWRTLYNLATSAAVAVGVYKAAMYVSTAAIASQNVAQVTLNASKMRQIEIESALIAGRGRLMASIIGENAAMKVTEVRVNALVAAKARAAVATNVLTASFWKLTVAMLSNPWILVATAIAGAVTALVMFRKEAETTGQLVEKLNMQVSDIGEATKGTDELIESYDRLSKSAARTAPEEKKLAASIKELGRLYPGAITQVDKYGNATEINISKVKELRKAIDDQNRALAQKTLDEAIKKSNEYQKSISVLQETLSTGYIKAGAGLPSRIKLTEKDLDKIREKLKSEQEEWRNLDTVIENSMKILRDGVSLPTPDLAEWQEKIISFGAVDRNQIESMGKLPEILESVAKQYKSSKEELDQYNKALKTVSETEKAELIKLRDIVKGRNDAQKATLDYFNAMNLTEKKTKTTDPRIKALMDEVKYVKEAQKRYEDLKKSMTAADAAAEIRKLYQGQLSQLDLGFTTEEIVAELNKALSLGQKYLDKGDKLSISLDVSGYQVDDISKKLKKDLEKMTKEIEDQQKANKFYEKMLGLTADTQLSTSLTMSFYGFNPSDVRQKMIDNLQSALGGIDMSVDTSGIFEFDKIIDQIRTSELPDEQKKMLEQMVNNLRAYDIDNIEALYSSLDKYSEYEKQRTDIARRGEEERKRISESVLPVQEKQVMVTQSYKKEDRELAKVEFTEFKESDLYIKMFEDLDKVSTASLQNIREHLSKLKESLGDSLAPEQMKTLISSFEDVDKELSSRNPFRSLIQGFKDYSAQSVSMKEANAQVATSTEKLFSAEERLSDLREKRNKISREGGDVGQVEEEIKLQGDVVKSLKKQVTEYQNIADSIKRNRENIANGLAETANYLSGAGEAMGSIMSFMQEMGVDAETSSLMASMGDVKNVIEGAGDAAQGASKIMKGDLIGGVKDVVSGIAGMATGFIGIFTGLNRRVAKANKIVKEQEAVIKDLERAYKRLEKAAEDALGEDWVRSQADQLQILRDKETAIRKQLEAEKSKGKKTDEGKVQEYKDAILEAQQAIMDKQKEVNEVMLGTNVPSAAKDFASEWLEAYLSFEDTTDAIKGKFKEMLKNMLVESVMAKAIEDRVEKLFKKAGGIWNSDNTLNMGALDQVLGLINTLPEEMNDALLKIAKSLNLKEMFEKEEGKKSTVTGIAKSTASLSEETGLVLAGVANSALYYQVGTYEEIVVIRTLIESRLSSNLEGGEVTGTVPQLIAVQNRIVEELQGIKLDTAALVISNREMADAINRVITPAGSKGAFQLNVSL